MLLIVMACKNSEQTHLPLLLMWDWMGTLKGGCLVFFNQLAEQ